MELRSDAAIIIPEEYEPPEEEDAPMITTLPGGLHAVVTHLGPYSTLSDAWMEFCGRAIPLAGLSPIEGLSFEMYVNDCSKVAPEDIRMDLYVPVAN
jgi:AraC family transcriptional regulator